MKHFVYSYRLTYCGGTAPCFDENLLSLAICKRDMRRVIGRRFEADREKGEQNTYWFIGIVGTQLSNETVDGSSEKPFDGRKDDILYIAKLDDVVPYEEYFTNNELYVSRKDHIYEESSKGSYPIKHKQGENDKRFRHVPGNGVHKDKDDWNRDWDIAHPNTKHYVLLAKEYAFFEHPLKFDVYEDENTKFAKGVGHTWFEAADDDGFITFLKKKLSSVDENHGTYDNLITLASRKKGCGKDKG